MKFLNDYRNSDGKIIIAGPCSVESEEQIKNVVDGLDLNTIKIFRGGIWKPRTKPGNFEGVGEPGLHWMKYAQDKGFAISTEVANKQHVENCLVNHKVDILWVGARTTVNPFTVQEIAESIQEYNKDTIVLIKNPVNPDIDLWVGAIERFENLGIKNIGLIFRGFSMHTVDKYRNKPLWKIAIEMKRRYPQYPMIVDPSHIGGDSEYLFEISQKAWDLNFDGLMVESHNNPKEALSDNAQQIEPEKVNSMIDLLTIKNKIGNGGLTEFREHIDELDNELMEILKQRFRITKEIGKWKRERDIPVLDLNRWNKIIQDKSSIGRTYGLDDEFIFKLFEVIHNESIKNQ